MLWLYLVFVFLAGSLEFLDKGLFELSYTDSDGFYGQMKPFIEGFSFGDLQTLQYIHFLRYIVVSPFVLGEQYGLGGIYFACILLLFALPILKVEYHKFGYYLMCLMLLFPVVLSFRTFLVGCGIAYLIIALYHHKSYSLLAFSLLISTLSSATLLVWVILFVCNIRAVLKQYKMFSYIALTAVLLILMPPLVNKMIFAEEELGGDLLGYLYRGTLVVSFIEHQWSRLFIYVLLTVSTVLIMVRGFVASKKRFFYLSFSAFLVGALFEGLGLVCGLVAVLMFYSGFRLRVFKVDNRSEQQ